MDVFQTVRRRLIETVDKCELCGTRRGLEVHHIIPRVCGGTDAKENLIVICSGCHAKLTPRGILTKSGLYASSENLLSMIETRFYGSIKDENYHMTAADVVGLFSDVMQSIRQQCQIKDVREV